MDAPIVNIIVTIAIVLYVLRRMQEVSRKGRDITAPPIPQSMFGDKEADDEEQDDYPELMSDDRETPHEDEMRRRETGRRSVHEELRPDTVQRRFAVPEAPPPPRAHRTSSIPMPSSRRYRAINEDRLESQPFTSDEDEGSRTFDRAAKSPHAAASTGETDGHRRQPARGIVPHFGRRELIRGIIMREVLGPPVGMRSGAE